MEIICVLITTRDVAIFSDFQSGFRSLLSTADLLAVLSDRICWNFNLCITKYIHIYSKLLTGFSMLVFCTISDPAEFQIRYFALFHPFSVIDHFEWLWMGMPS